jgi:hypothetical protein
VSLDSQRERGEEREFLIADDNKPFWFLLTPSVLLEYAPVKKNNKRRFVSREIRIILAFAFLFMH